MIGPGLKRTHHVAVGVKKVKPWRAAHAMADVPGRHGHHSIAYRGPVVIILRTIRDQRCKPFEVPDSF